MNQTFSFTRFARLNSWLWATKSRTYLFGAGALLLISMLILSRVLGLNEQFSVAIQRDHIAYFFILSLLLMGSVGSDVFSALFRQESAITYLMIPASKAEKFWLGVLYCVVAVVLFSVVFFGYEAITFSIANGRLPASQPDRYVPSLAYFWSAKGGNRGVLAAIAYTLPLALAVALLGSFFFRRGVFVRNVGVALMAAIGLIFLYVWVVRLQFGQQEVGTSFPFSGTHVEEKGVYNSFSPPAWLTYLTYGGTLLGLWIIARIRFNEIER